MEIEIPVTEERISRFDPPIHSCFTSNISEPDSSESDEPLVRSSLSMTSIFPANISEADSTTLSDERLSQSFHSIQSLFPPPSTQKNSPRNDEITPSDPIESCFPPRCDSDSYELNMSNRNWSLVSIDSYFPPCGSSSATSVSSTGRKVESYSFGGQILEKPNLKVFTFSELKTSTNNFKADTLLGEAAFGKVYKGCMDEKRLSPSKVGTRKSTAVVAIKRLSPESIEANWQKEVDFLGRLLHPNLVKLFGYCKKNKELLLVYEFMHKGSLDNHLFRRNNREPLSWEMRLKILIEVARSLAFLHSSEIQVIHHGVRASNILLDGKFTAKLSSFGRARLGPSSYDTRVSNGFEPLCSYNAPEYISKGHLNVNSDVYGFGVVLLEMLTSLRAYDTTRPDGQQNLVYWLKPYLSNERMWPFIMDTRIKGQYSSNAAFQAVQLTLQCLERDLRSRPSMKDVVEVLEHIKAIEKPKETHINSTHSITHGHGQQAIHHHSPLHVGNHGAET